MKKISLGIIIFSSAQLTMAGGMGAANEYHWTGFYLGANTGYWWSQTSGTLTSGAPGLVNDLNPAGSGAIAVALAASASNQLSSGPNGFLVGGETGYNYVAANKWLLGFDAGLDWLAQSHVDSQSAQFTTLLSFPNEYYLTETSVAKKINYLGSLRARFGYLYTESLLLYGAGGLAYGGVSWNQLFIASQSSCPYVYPTVITRNNYGDARTGWTIGAGAEWMFKPQWSAKIEYLYADLGTRESDTLLTQFNNLEIPAVQWSSANVHSSTRFATGALRIGINYHFSV